MMAMNASIAEAQKEKEEGGATTYKVRRKKK